MKKRTFNLQLFADGAGEGQAEGTGTEQSGSEVQVQEGQNATDKKSFRELIEGDYKDDYEKELKKALGKRLKGRQGTEKELERYRKLDVALGMLSDRYKIDSKNGLNLEALEEAIRSDKELFAEQAAEIGMDPAALLNQKQLELENRKMKAQMDRYSEEVRRRAQYEELLEKEKEVQKLYPEFDLNTEMQNPSFGRLVASGIDLKTAYFAVHREEIQKATMEFSARKASEAVAANVAANQARPNENGASGVQNATFKTDPKDLTKEEREEIKRRVRRGERVVI